MVVCLPFHSFLRLHSLAQMKLTVSQSGRTIFGLPTSESVRQVAVTNVQAVNITRLRSWKSVEVVCKLVVFHSSKKAIQRSEESYRALKTALSPYADSDINCVLHCHYEFFTLTISQNNQHPVVLLLVDHCYNGRKLYCLQQTLVTLPCQQRLFSWCSLTVSFLPSANTSLCQQGTVAQPFS